MTRRAPPRARAALAALLLASVAPPADGAEQSPAASWRTITTEHFRLHYPAPFEEWARHTAARLEPIHERVTAFVGYRPEERLDVVVLDPAADANGMALPLLDRPSIVLWSHAPEAESAIGAYRDWTELLVTHEVAHIVHLARPRNRSRGILARLSPLPLGPLARKAPRWVTEGYATLVEGALTGSGRPNGSLRAMVLRRFAMEGKLPRYGALDGADGWLAGSMAYLVGSAYLEWLEERGGEGSLVKLWQRLASRRGGSFPSCFRGVFGEEPRDLYDRFAAEITAAALAEEERREAAGLVEGELWQRLPGMTTSLQVSPDGTRLLAYRAPPRGDAALVVWSLPQTDEERRAEEERLREEDELLSDPAEVADRLPVPRPRRPPWRLGSRDGMGPGSPRFLDGGRSVLFGRRSRDAEGVLHRDLFVWEIEAGNERRVTRRADVGMADPFPDGRHAVAVRARHGKSALVRVDLGDGSVAPLLPGDDGRADVVWNHPRVAPDGSRIVALRHAEGAWRAVVVDLAPDLAASAPRELALPGSPAGPPAFDAGGSHAFLTVDAGGTWNVVRVELATGAASPVTAVKAGALGPAPTPDGKALFYLELSAKGVDVRRLELGREAHPSGNPEAYPVDPPRPAAAAALPAVDAPEAHRYRVAESHVVRTFVSATYAPQGAQLELGLQGSDTLPRLNWLLLGAAGDRARPWAGAALLAWRGLPVTLCAHLFVERALPGEQHLLSRPELDRDRAGLVLDAAWRRHVGPGSFDAALALGSSRVEPDGGDAFARSVAAARGGFSWGRSRDRLGMGISGHATFSQGQTDGEGWSQERAALTLSGRWRRLRLELGGAAGTTHGDPTIHDLFSLGGTPTTMLPDSIDLGRVVSPALPAATQLGPRFEHARAALTYGAGLLPVIVYGESLRAWNEESARPGRVAVLGLETRLDSDVLEGVLPGKLELQLGAALVRSDEPELDDVTGYAGLLYRP